MAQVLEAGKKYFYGHLWIGLYLDSNAWEWSLQNEDYYGEGEKNYRMWKLGEPSNSGGIENCAVLFSQGTWNDAPCSNMYSFVCINGTEGSYNFVMSAESKSWNEAQSYCREHYIDLASVRNQQENDQIVEMANGKATWIGLTRGKWKWSDQSPLSFRQWNTIDNQPRGNLSFPCVLLHEDKWEGEYCARKLYFVCFATFVDKQLLRIRVTKNKSSWNLEDAAGAILQQMNETLYKRDHALGKNTKLAWRKQSDGKIFHPE
ncbi:macrophage mannose receptor 1-like [Mugil cephalus]|uniref:macrophage mannose receptor 1-like n=1 Tax=Mugil cephalus TaxID=48193 RepID=UPI001FB658F7|nr:macrophage mannose receptor 1-like [Mugil cephalus]